MTREEAKAYFKRHIDLYCVTGICREAEEMAIQALEQEPIRCKDCIHNNNCDIQYYAQAGDMFYCGMAESEG